MFIRLFVLRAYSTPFSKEKCNIKELTTTTCIISIASHTVTCVRVNTVYATSSIQTGVGGTVIYICNFKHKNGIVMSVKENWVKANKLINLSVKKTTLSTYKRANF